MNKGVSEKISQNFVVKIIESILSMREAKEFKRQRSLFLPKAGERNFFKIKLQQSLRKKNRTSKNLVFPSLI